MKSQLMFLGSFLSLGAALYLGYWMIYMKDSTASEKQEPQVLTAVMTFGRTIHSGDIVSHKSAKWRDYSKKDLSPDMVTKKNIADQALSFFSVARDIGSGKPVRIQDIIWPTDPKYLENTLRAGKNALFVFFDTESNMASTLRPGSYIDIVFTGAAGSDQTAKSNVYSKIVAEDIRVLDARNIRLPSEFTRQKYNRNYGSWLTLEVDTHEARVLTQAQKRGVLTPLLKSGASTRNKNVAVKMPFEFLLPGRVSGKLAKLNLPETVQRTVIVQRANQIEMISRSDVLVRERSND